MSNIESFIEKIENEFEELPKGSLQPTSAFKDKLNWSSINSVVLATMIEFEYGVMLSADDFKKVATVQDLLNLVESKKQS